MTRIAAKRQSMSSRPDGQSTGGKQNEPQSGEQPPNDQIARLIAELTKNYIETQGEKNSSPDQDMLSMLQKISNQLDSLTKQMGSEQSPDSDSQKQNDGGIKNQQQTSQASGNPNSASEESSDTPEDGSTTESELQTLFSRLLQNEKSKGNNKQQDDGQSSGQSKGAGNQSQRGNNPQTVTAKTAAQVLAQAQYELSAELEANLKKLKQVISDSENLANKISNLLGQENNK